VVLRSILFAINSYRHPSGENMSNCSKCGAQLAPGVSHCGTCGVTAMPADKSRHGSVSAIFNYVPHPHIAWRKLKGPVALVDMLARNTVMQRFNAFLAVRITNAVGTMWCAYLFAVLAFISLPEAVRGGTGTLVAWIAQTFLQLVLLSIIIVGQKVAGEASDKRALDTYRDAEAVLHEALQIQEHLAAQDKVLQKLIDKLSPPNDDC
jgi:hypothetical protein